MIDDALSSIELPASTVVLLDSIPAPTLPDVSLDVVKKKGKELFKVEQRKSWDKTNEARCDFSYRLRLTRRGDTNFISLWQKTIFGQTLTEIKSNPDMVAHFADALVELIRECLGHHLSDGSWAVVTTPMRRHISAEGNFATHIARSVARQIGAPFYFDCAHCSKRQRLDSVFTPNNIPSEPNVIVIEDFVTTGSTIKAMNILLRSLGKNPVFFAGINNKL